MTKRKADNTPSEHSPLIKSLRRSITDFLAENAANISNRSSQLSANGNNGSGDGLDLFDCYGQECWKKYRQRLATFDVKSRLQKPKKISPVECARYGWKSIDDDFIQCDDCGTVQCIKVPDDDVSIKVFNQCIWNIQRKLAESHTVICPWRTNGGLSTSNPYDIATRYKILTKSGQLEVPLVKGIIEENVLEKFGVNNNFFLHMAIFGWLPAQRSDPDANFLCHLCGRKLNSSVFELETPMNPLEQHHSYCPIVDKTFPLWRESLYNVHKLKVQEPLMPTLWNVKSMLKRIFDDGGDTLDGDNQEKETQDPESGVENSKIDDSHRRRTTSMEELFPHGEKPMPADASSENTTIPKRTRISI